MRECPQGDTIAHQVTGFNLSIRHWGYWLGFGGLLEEKEQ
jgi:hypothetical protein